MQRHGHVKVHYTTHNEKTNVFVFGFADVWPAENFLLTSEKTWLVGTLGSGPRGHGLEGFMAHS